MGTSTTTLSVEIAAPPARVFAALTSLGSMTDRLGRSPTYAGTVDVSDDPIRVGTTYTDRTPIGRLRGRVLELDPGCRIVFHQATRGDGLAVRIEYEVVPSSGGTRVTRTGRITTSGALALVHPAVVWATVRENRRTLERLRAALESERHLDR